MSDLKPNGTTVTSPTADDHVPSPADEKKVNEEVKDRNIEDAEEEEEIQVTQKAPPRKLQNTAPSFQGEQKDEATQKLAKKQRESQDDDEGEEEVQVTQKAVKKKDQDTLTQNDGSVTQRGKFSDLNTLRKQQLIDQNQDIGENKNQFTSMKTVSNIDELLPAALDSALILYKGRRILCSQILNEYKGDYQDKNLIVKRASAKQILVSTDSTQVKPLATTEDVEEFLKQHSKAYTHVIQVDQLARGGEAVVYRLNHTGTDEVVVKTPLFKPDISKDELLMAYESIFYESQTLKMCPLKSSVCEIKEEIIEYNKEAQIITRYCAIVEKAEYTLSNLINIWNNEKEREQKMEWFTPEKLAYYFYQMMYAMQYMHQKRIFYSDMKGPNVLIFRSQQIKLGDLGISVRLNRPSQGDPKIANTNEDEGNLEIYYGKGLTVGYVTDWYQECFENDVPLSMAALFECDQYALIQTIKLAINNVEDLQKESTVKTPELPYYKQMLNDLADGDLSSTLQKWTNTFREDWNFIQTLVKQLQKEQKHFAIENVLLLSKYHDEVHTLLGIQSQLDDVSSYDLIEEDKAPEEEEELILGNNIKQKLDNERLIMQKDPIYKQMLITLLLSFNPESEYEFISKIFKQMAPSFRIQSEDIVFDIDFMLTFFKQDAQTITKFKQLIHQNKNEIQDAILFKDAEISTAPKAQRANLMNFGMLPLIKFANYFNLYDMHAYLLLRASNIYFGKYESKSFTEECLMISERISRNDYIQQCKVNLAILANETEADNAIKMIDEAEPELIQLYGQHSFEYARLCSAKSHYYRLIQRFDSAVLESNKSLIIYQTLLGEGAIQTLDTYKELASLYKELKQDDANLRSYENFAMKYVKSQYSDKILDFQQFKIYARTNRTKLVDGIKNFEFGSLIFKCLAVSYFNLQQELPEYSIDGLINGSNFYDRVHNLALATIGQNYGHLRKIVNHIQKDIKTNKKQTVSLDLYRKLCKSKTQEKSPKQQLRVSKYFGMMSDIFDKYFDDLEITLPYFKQSDDALNKTKLYQVKIFYDDKGIIGLQSGYKLNQGEIKVLPVRGKIDQQDHFHVVNILDDEQEHFTDISCQFNEDSMVMELLQLFTNKRVFTISKTEIDIVSVKDSNIQAQEVLIGFAGAQNTDIISQIYGWKILTSNTAEPDIKLENSNKEDYTMELKKYQQLAQNQAIIESFKELNTNDFNLKKLQQDYINHYNGMLVYVGQTNNFNIPEGVGKMIMKNGDIKEGFWKNGYMNGYGYAQNYEGLYQEGIWKQGFLVEGEVQIPCGTSFNITNSKEYAMTPQIVKQIQDQNISTRLVIISNQFDFEEAIIIWKRQILFQANIRKQPQKAVYFRPHYQLFRGEIDNYDKEKNGELKQINGQIAQIKDSLLILKDKYGDIYYTGDITVDNRAYYGTKYYYCSEGGCILYEGEFLNKQFNGKGKLYDIYGNKVYEGQFKQGYKQGEGIQYNSDGTIDKEGTFNDLDSAPHQELVLDYSDIEYFKGYPNQKESYTLMLFRIGHETCHYIRELYFNSNLDYEGLWDFGQGKNREICYRKFNHAEKTPRVEEEFKMIKNSQHLQKRRIYINYSYSDKKIENYIDGKKHGICYGYNKDVLIEETIYVNGLKHGPAKIFQEKKFMEVFTYVDDVQQGLSQYLNSDQSVHKEFYYKDGKEDIFQEMKNFDTGECRQVRDGMVFWYKPDNNKLPGIPITYPVGGEADVFQKYYEYQDSGKKSMVADFNVQTAQFDGKAALYYQNGQLFVEGQIEKGQKVGNWIFRKDSGEPFMEIIYKYNNTLKMIVANDGTKQIVKMNKDYNGTTYDTQIFYSNGAKFKGQIEYDTDKMMYSNCAKYTECAFINANGTGNSYAGDIEIKHSMFSHENMTTLSDIPGAKFLFSEFEVDSFLCTIEYEERGPLRDSAPSPMNFEWNGKFDGEHCKWKQSQLLNTTQEN